MDCSPPGSSVHGIFQARILEWVVISFSRGSSRDWTWISCFTGRVYHLSHQGSPVQRSWQSRGNWVNLWHIKQGVWPRTLQEVPAWDEETSSELQGGSENKSQNKWEARPVLPLKEKYNLDFVVKYLIFSKIGKTPYPFEQYVFSSKSSNISLQIFPKFLHAAQPLPELIPYLSESQVGWPPTTSKPKPLTDITTH